MAQWLASLAYHPWLSPLWVHVPQVTMQRTCPNMTLAIERDVKLQLWPLTLLLFVCFQLDTVTVYNLGQFKPKLR